MRKEFNGDKQLNFWTTSGKRTNEKEIANDRKKYYAVKNVFDAQVMILVLLVRQTAWFQWDN